MEAPIAYLNSALSFFVSLLSTSVFVIEFIRRYRSKRFLSFLASISLSTFAAGFAYAFRIPFIDSGVLTPKWIVLTLRYSVLAMLFQIGSFVLYFALARYVYVPRVMKREQRVRDEREEEIEWRSSRP